MTTTSALEAERGSAIRRGREPTASRMSARLWKIQWSSWTAEGVSAEVGPFEDAAPFIAAHYPTIFATEPNRFLEERMTDAKRRFVAECDAFLFRADEKLIAIGLGHPTDWSTYYIRTFALLPEYRNRGIVRAFVAHTADDLARVGVERIEFETSPGNLPMNRAFLGMGAIATGTANSERWGALVRYTLHLTPEARRVFQHQFMIVPDFGRGKTGTGEKGETP